MSRILIVDDESMACASLLSKIQRISSKAHDIRTKTNPTLALDTIREWSPDIVFLDISMPEMSGFQLIEQIEPEDRNFSLVFCTAHNDFALDAFRVAAVDYLLKPVIESQLEEALQRALENSRSPEPELLDGHQDEYLDRLVLRKSKKTYITQVFEIQYFQSLNHETVAFSGSEELFCELSLSRLESRLNPGDFFRCHRSTIVNMNHVDSFDSETLELTIEGQKIKVAKRSKSDLLKRLNSD